MNFITRQSARSKHQIWSIPSFFSLKKILRRKFKLLNIKVLGRTLFWVRYLLFLIWKLRKQVRISDNYRENRQRRPELEPKFTWTDWIASGPTGTNRIRPKVSICSKLFWTRDSLSGLLPDELVCLEPIVFIFFNPSNQMTLNQTIHSFVLKHLTNMGFRQLYKILKIPCDNGFSTCRQLKIISRQKKHGVKFNATDETKPIKHVSICYI